MITKADKEELLRADHCWGFYSVPLGLTEKVREALVRSAIAVNIGLDAELSPVEQFAYYILKDSGVDFNEPVRYVNEDVIKSE